MVDNSALYSKGLATSCSALASPPGGIEAHLHYRHNAIPDDSGLMNLKIAGSSSFGDTGNAEKLISVVRAEVQGALVIDLHTHLLPPSHGALCLWGIDELLTYVRHSGFS